MTQRKGLPAKLALTDADDTRYDFRNLVTCNADGTPRGGITAPLTPLVTATATMNVTVAAYSAIAVRDAGAILISNDGPTTVLLANAPVSNSRIDTIYAKQNDASSTVTAPDANNNAVLGVVVGTASPTPSAPAVPVGGVKLAEVLVPANVTATNGVGVVITQADNYTAAPGGDVYFRSINGLNGWTNPRDGQRAYVADARLTLQYSTAGPGWNIASGAPSYVGISYNSLYQAAPTNSAGVYRQAGRIYGEGAVVNVSQATWAADTQYILGSIPVGFAPAKRVVAFAPWGTTGGGQLSVETNGNIIFRPSTAPGTVAAGVLTIWLSGLSWAEKTL